MATRKKRPGKRSRPRKLGRARTTKKQAARTKSVAANTATRLPMWLAVEISDRMGTRGPWTASLSRSGLVLAHVKSDERELIVLAPPTALGHFLEDDDAEIRRITPIEANALRKRGVPFESHGW